MKDTLFIHGLGQNKESWNTTLAHLSDNINALTVNLFELTEERDYEKLYESFGMYCNQFSKPLNLCGLSLGATLALHYTLNHPEKVNSLILIAPQYKMPKGLLKVQNVIFKILPKKTFNSMGLTKKEVIQLTTSMIDLDFTDKVEKIRCSTKILCGGKDKVNLKSSKKLVHKIQSAQFYLVEGAGHEVNTDKPIKLALMINKFSNESSFE